MMIKILANCHQEGRAVHPDLERVRALAATDPRELVFFVGAGLSVPLGFPDLGGMLSEAIQYGCLTSRLSDTEAELAASALAAARYLECGEILQRLLGARLTQFLSDRFSISRLPADLHAYEFLVRVPCAGFITTNYDAALDRSGRCSPTTPRPLGD